MTQNTTVEELQTQVDQVAKDLAELKKETSEDNKKSKAEAAAEKLRTAREEINKRLDALKGLADEKSKAEIVKLEAMLKTLESSSSELDQLKLAVTAPVMSETAKMPESVDNSSDFTVITTGIATMKTLVVELQKVINDYLTQKKSMTETDQKTKEQEIDQKKKAIDAKRKEIQDTIDKIKKGWKEFKIDEITDAAVKKAIMDQKNKEETSLAQYEKDLKAIETPTTTFREKVQAGANKVRDKVKTGAEKARERGKENPGKAIAATAGIGLLIRGISKLFRRKKKSEEEGGEKKEKKEKKGFWDRRYGKALKRGLIGTGAAWLLRGLFGGKWDLFGLGKPSENPNNTQGPETVPGAPGAASEAQESFEKKIPEIKQAYNDIGLNINSFYAQSYGQGKESGSSEDDMFGESDFEKNGTENLPGTVVFMLDNRYATINDLLNENAFAGEVAGADINKALSWLKSRTGDQVKKFLEPIAAKFDSATWGLIKAAKGVDDIANAIKGKPDAEKIITMVFRKSMKVMAYMQNRKVAFERELVKEKLLSDNTEGFKDKKPEDQEKAITYYLKDKKFYEDNIKSDIESSFLSKRMVEFQDGKMLDCGYKALKEKNLIEANIEKKNKEDLDELDEERKELLGEEDDGSNKLEQIKENIKDGKLDAEDQKMLEEFCDDFVEIMETSGKHTYLNKYFFLLELFNTETNTGEKIYETSEYKKFVEMTKKKVQEILKKSKEGKLTAGNVDELKTAVDDYYVLQKELTISTYEVHQSRDENNNLVARITFTIRKGIRNFTEGVELIGQGEWFKGGAILAGNILAVNIIRHPRKSMKQVFKMGKRTVEKGFNVAEKLTGKAIRNKLPFGRGARRYNESALNYDICRGNISLERAMEVAKRKERRVGYGANSPFIKNEEQLLEHLFPGRNDYAELKMLLNKYKGNNSLFKELVRMRYNGKRYKAKDRFRLDKTKMTFEIDPDALTKLKDIEIRITGFKTSTEQTIFRNMMKHAKSLSQAEDLATMGIDAKYLKYFEGGSEQLISAEKFGKYLGRYGKKINAEQMGKLMEFFQKAKAANKLTAANQETIVLNAMRNFNRLEAKGFNVGSIDELKLNVSHYEKVATKIKTGINNMIKDLKAMTKNPKMKVFRPKIESKIVNLTEYEKTVTPESIKAINESAWLDRITGFGKLSPEGIKALSSLNALLKTGGGAELLKALQSTKNIDEIKDILTKAGIDASKIDDGVLMKIAETKNASKIKSIINYGSEMDSISTFQKVLKNPTMKAFGRWLGIAGVAIDAIFLAQEVSGHMEDAGEIKRYNVERASNKESEAYFDAVVGGLGVAAGACAFIPGIGWVASGALLVTALGMQGVKEVGSLYYGEIDKFKQNYQDFLRQDLPKIKQHIVYVNSRQTGLDSSFQDFWSKITGNLAKDEKKKVAFTTAKDAVKAMVYFDELQKYPYALGDLNSDEVRKNPELKALVEQQKDEHEKSVTERFEYIQKNYIENKPNIIPADRIKRGEGIQALDEILDESRVYQAVAKDESYADKTNVQGYKKYLEDGLKKTDAGSFNKLEALYKKQSVEFYTTLAQLPYYEGMQSEYGKESDQERISKNLDFFKRYMAYKTVGLSISDMPTIDFDQKKIDYDEINAFLLSFGTVATGLTEAEATDEHIEYLDDNQINKKYNVSINVGQNVLYEIAHSKLLGYTGANDITSLKTFFSETAKDVHGIYYDGKDRMINQNWAIDVKIGNDDEIKDIKTISQRITTMNFFQDGTYGKMITENSSLNQEYIRTFIKIIQANHEDRTNKFQGNKKAILQYIKDNSKGKFIELNPDAIILGTRSGIKNIGMFVYKRNGNRFESKTPKKGVICDLLK